MINLNKGAGLVAVAVAVCGLLAFGIMGVGRAGGAQFHDVRYFYLAAQMIQEGLNPYKYDDFQLAAHLHNLYGTNIGVFPYPPQSLLIWQPLTWVSYDVARWLWACTNLALIAIFAWLQSRLYVDRSIAAGEGKPYAANLWITAILIGNPFVAHLVWTGQTGLLILGCLLASMHAMGKSRWLMAGVLLGLASVKPQLSVLFFVWVAATAQFRVLAVSGITVAIMLLFAVFQAGIGAVTEWIHAATAYQAEVASGLGHNTNLRSLFLGLDFPVSRMGLSLFPIFAFLYVFILAFRHRHRPFYEGDIIAVLLTTTLLFVYGRDYDIAVLYPLVGAMWWHSRRKPRHVQVLALLVLAILCLPYRWVIQLNANEILFWRIFLLGTLWVWISFYMWQETSRSPTKNDWPT